MVCQQEAPRTTLSDEIIAPLAPTLDATAGNPAPLIESIPLDAFQLAELFRQSSATPTATAPTNTASIKPALKALAAASETPTSSDTTSPDDTLPSTCCAPLAAANSGEVSSCNGGELFDLDPYIAIGTTATFSRSISLLGSTSNSTRSSSNTSSLGNLLTGAKDLSVRVVGTVAGVATPGMVVATGAVLISPLVFSYGMAVGGIALWQNWSGSKA